MSKLEALKILKSGHLKFGDENHIEASRVIDFQAQLEEVGRLQCNECGGSGRCECCDSECGHCDGEGTLDGQHSIDLEKALVKWRAVESGKTPVFVLSDKKQMILHI